MSRIVNWLHYSLTPVAFIAFTVFYLFVFGDYALFFMTALIVYLFAVARAFNIYSRKRMKAGLIVTYTALLLPQLISLDLVVFNPDFDGVKAILARLSGILLVLSPFVIERITTITNHTIFAVPSIQEAGTLSYSLFDRSKTDFNSAKKTISKIKNTMSPDSIKELVEDLPRHSSVSYINEGSLTPAYFEKANNSLDDPYIYIVVSNTGSAASELISVFTRKQFNHVSLSFDEHLDTIISYNGGEKIYPPGLNAEMLSFFNKKEDASVGVYRLKITVEKKKILIDTVKDINEEGSAYNLIGLVFKYSHRPNIMFCSQFVYSMLKKVDLHYFEKRPELVQPTDLVELDYLRKLEFVRLLTFK